MGLRGAVGLMLLMAAPVSAQSRDATYPQRGWVHNASKASYSLTVYTVAEELHLAPRWVNVTLSTVGLWSLGMIAERGHTFDWRDKAGDLATHAVIVVPVSLKRTPRVALSAAAGLIGAIVVFAKYANPSWS